MFREPIDEQELTRQRARELKLPDRVPFDEDEVVWGPRIPDPSEEQFDAVQGILGSKAAA